MACLADMPREKDLTFQMRVSEGFLRYIDKWRGTQFPVPSRAEAIRHLCAVGVQWYEDQRKAERKKR